MPPEPLYVPEKGLHLLTPEDVADLGSLADQMAALDAVEAVHDNSDPFEVEPIPLDAGWRTSTTSTRFSTQETGQTPDQPELHK